MSSKLPRGWAVVGLLVVAAGCGESGGGKLGVEQAASAEAENGGLRWGHSDDPTLFDDQLSYRFDELPLQGEAERVPWAASYWPTYQDSINYKWDGPASMSAAAKYGAAFAVQDIEQAISSFRGIDRYTDRKECSQTSECDGKLGEICGKRAGVARGRCIPDWWGICHAWAPAAILEPEPVRPVVHNGVTFKVNDLKALMSLMYDRVHTKFVSLRCDKDDGDGGIEYDSYGRPVGDDAECMDTNPGTYHVIMANYLGRRGQSFVEDRTFDSEVWNQPMRGYRVTHKEEVTARRANELVGASAGGDRYLFNPDAERFVYLRVTTEYITESPSELDGNLTDEIDAYTHDVAYEYVLELDGQGLIIGGEWVGASKKNHPDFLWLPTGRALNSVANGAVRYEHVRALLDRSIAPDEDDGQGGGGSAVQPVVQTGTVLAGAWLHFGPYELAAGATTRVILSGTGDADLYVRRGSKPTESAYDCRPYADDSDEQCTIQGPGPLFVAVNGYAAESSYRLEVTLPEAASGGTPPPPSSAHLNETGHVGLGASAYYTVPVRKGTPIVVRTAAPGDVDLYVKLGARPTPTAHDVAAESYSGDETMTYTPTADGTLHVLVYGYQASSFTLGTSDL